MDTTTQTAQGISPVPQKPAFPAAKVPGWDFSLENAGEPPKTAPTFFSMERPGFPPISPGPQDVTKVEGARMEERKKDDSRVVVHLSEAAMRRLEEKRKTSGLRSVEQVVQAAIDEYVAKRPKFSQAADALTPRQRQVLQLIAEGKKTKDIATHLKISVKTVEMHRSQLMESLGLHNVASLVRFAIRTGLIDP